MEWLQPLINWIDKRLPFRAAWDHHAGKYYVPRNLNFWYFFGVFSFLVLLNQIITGVWLTMYYTPTSQEAFASVEYIMRDVHFGWLLRYMHSTGASAFFIVIYLHMYRGIMYGSFKAPRELVWLIGMTIFAFLLMESAAGYVLPWGQMSYWAIKVIINVFTVIPWIGNAVATWLQGDYNVSGVTLHRFFSFHVIAFPLIILFLAWLHIIALHQVGSNNPTGIDPPREERIPFHPYYTVKDFSGVVIFLTLFCGVIFFWPMVGGYFLEKENFIPANPLVTPLHIAPPWYLAPFYSILRAIPHKLLGVVCAVSSIILLFILPWLDRSRVRSIHSRGIYFKIGLTILVVSFISLGYLGTSPLNDTTVFLSRIFTMFYFLFFVSLPFYSRFEKPKKIVNDLSQS